MSIIFIIDNYPREIITRAKTRADAIQDAVIFAVCASEDPAAFAGARCVLLRKYIENGNAIQWNITAEFRAAVAEFLQGAEIC